MDKDLLLAGLKQIKEAFKGKEKFTDAKLNDGTTIIRYDAETLEIGTPVMVVTDQGAAPIPDGEYTLEDGTMMVCAGGVVAEIMPVEEAPEEEAAPATPPANEMSESQTAQVKRVIESTIKESQFAKDVKALTEKVEVLTKEKEQFSATKTEDEKTISELNARVETLSESFSKALELMEKIAGEPTDKPAEGTKSKQVFKNRKEVKEYLNGVFKASSKTIKN